MRRIIHIVCFSLFLFGVFPAAEGVLYAAGKREDRIPEAEFLIQERRYNEAIHLLSEIMRDDPDNFDRAEELMRDVKKTREQYNTIYARLIAILDAPEGEEIDEDAAYDVIRELEELDMDPNPAAVAAFAQARRSIIFAVNDRQFQAVLRDAARLLEQEEYALANEVYLSGFTIHKDLFVESEYGSLAESLTETNIREVENAAESLPFLFDDLTDLIFLARGAAEEGNFQLLRNLVTELSPRFIEIASLRNTIELHASRLEDLRNSIQREDESDVPFLSSLRVLSRGRADQPVREGITGSVERFLEDRYSPLVEEVTEIAVNLYRETVNAYQSKEMSLFAGSEELTSLVAETAYDLLTLWNPIYQPDPALALDPGEEMLPERWLTPAISMGGILDTSEEYTALMELYTAERNLGAQHDLSTSAEEVRAIRSELLELREGIRRSLSRLEEMETRYSQTGVGASISAVAAALAEARSSLGENIDLEIRLVDTYADFRYEPVDEFLGNALSRIESAERDNEGFEAVIVEESAPITVRYPRRAFGAAEELQPEIRQADELASSIVRELENESAPVGDSPAVTAQIERGRELRRQFSDFLRRSGEIIAEAERLNRAADLALQEGDLRFGEAGVQLERANFEVSRQRLEQAAEAFGRSLTFREDPVVRARIDEEIPRLAGQILFEQNQAIVREVRGLITEGRRLFLQEDFLGAEQVFSRAQSRWRLTNAEDEPEIDIWLTRVRRALDATSGVLISETDPLYPEVVQVLNLARQDYLRGREAFQRGDRDAARRFFTSAEQKIEYVKEPFPNNQDASVLYLRILEFTQPTEFNAILRDRLAEARAQIRTVPEDAYRELKILEEINPNLTGLRQAIFDAEIATGIRQPPVDPARLARARQLVQQARQIVDQDIRANFPVALTYLNEAISLDPEFDEAVLLKDRIQAATGGGVTVVLSSVDQQDFRRAEELFIQARYFEASAIISRLLQNPANQRNQRVIDLQRRISSRL